MVDVIIYMLVGKLLGAKAKDKDLPFRVRAEFYSLFARRTP